MPKKKKDELESIGQKIKKVRTKKKMPLDAMANETGFSIDYLKKIEALHKLAGVNGHCTTGEHSKKHQSVAYQTALLYTRQAAFAPKRQ